MSPLPCHEKPLFDVVLYPHRSLTPYAAAVLSATIAAACLVIGIVFLTMGAWPILGFFGLDVALVVGAFWLNFRRARLRETVRLTPSRLHIERVYPSGRRCQWDLHPFWTRVQDGAPHGLTLTSKGRELTIGRFLNKRDCITLGQALRQALAQRH